MPRLLYNPCFGAWETGPGSRKGRYRLNSGGLVLPRPGSISKLHGFPFFVPWTGGRACLARQAAASCSSNCSRACGLELSRQSSLGKKGGFQSQESTSQHREDWASFPGIPNIKSQSLLNNRASPPHFKGKGALQNLLAL